MTRASVGSATGSLNSGTWRTAAAYKTRPRPRSKRKVVLSTVYDYAAVSTAHGVSYICDKDLKASHAHKAQKVPYSKFSKERKDCLFGIFLALYLFFWP